MNKTYLSKSSYCSCMQCEKILWLNKYKKESSTAEMNESVFETGRKVGELAKSLFGDYVDIPFDSKLNEKKKKTEEFLKDNPNVITEASFIYDNNLKYLDKIEGFQEYHRGAADDGSGASAQEEQVEMDESPMELFVSAFNRVNNTLAAELMDEVMQLSPTDFESLVVQLLLKMGYGDGIDNAGKVTRATGDGGIDGMIKEDQLGFSYIYIQAKQWAPDRRVDRPEIQKFAGALQGEKAMKGLFITTAKFSSGARQYAENLHGSTIVLIDGTQLMKLMIKFNVGVSVDHVYEVKRIDTDFFNEGL